VCLPSERAVACSSRVHAGFATGRRLVHPIHGVAVVSGWACVTVVDASVRASIDRLAAPATSYFVRPGYDRPDFFLHRGIARCAADSAVITPDELTCTQRRLHASRRSSFEAAWLLCLSCLVLVHSDCRYVRLYGFA